MLPENKEKEKKNNVTYINYVPSYVAIITF